MEDSLASGGSVGSGVLAGAHHLNISSEQQPTLSQLTVYPRYGGFTHGPVSNDNNVGRVDGTVVLGSVLIMHSRNPAEGSEILDSRGGNYETRLNLTHAKDRASSIILLSGNNKLD